MTWQRTRSSSYHLHNCMCFVIFSGHCCIHRTYQNADDMFLHVNIIMLFEYISHIPSSPHPEQRCWSIKQPFGQYISSSSQKGLREFNKFHSEVILTVCPKCFAILFVWTCMIGIALNLLLKRI